MIKQAFFYMKTAIIFPGQGSQFVGMGADFYQKYSVSKEIFNELDVILDRNLTQKIFAGNAEEISMTENAQPSIMATSIAIFSALIYEKIITKNTYTCVAGHSLGEYSALVANESLSFRDSVKLLKVRSSAMQKSMPLGTGGMVAVIGCSYDLIKNILPELNTKSKIFIANDNANGQIVLSGEVDAVQYVLDNYKDYNIKKAIRIPVSAPFHCELMKNASDIMRDEVLKYTFKPFDVPLYSNVTSYICNHHEVPELLVKQVVARVRWREIVENMINDGIERFIEIGPGNVLTNLVKRISKNVMALSISRLEDINKLDKIKK